MRQACEKGAWKKRAKRYVYCGLSDNTLKDTSAKLTKLIQICQDACWQLGLNYQK